MELLDRHMAKAMVLKLLIMQAQKWTFDSDNRIPPEDTKLLREVRDEFVKQLEGNLRFVQKAATR